VVTITPEWRVITHLMTSNKVENRVGNKRDACEYARQIQRFGVYYTDDRGIITYFPAWQVFKVKVVPPDVELQVTETNV